MRRLLITLALVLALVAVPTADPVAGAESGKAAEATAVAARVPTDAVDACVSYDRITSTCFRTRPLRLQFGNRFYFRGRVGAGLTGPVTVWRMRPGTTDWARVGATTAGAHRRFTWQWRPTAAQVADGYYRFQFRVGGTRSNTLRVKVLLGLCDGDVCLQGYDYVPGELTIAVGDTVTWTSISNLTHTVDADDETTFESDLMNYGDSFAHTFTAAGVYAYHCDIHPRQLGTITVE